MTTILQKLLKYPHAAVFDKAPHAELVMRVRHDDGFVWSVADNVLSVTAGAFEADYDLTAYTVGELAAALEADGFQVNALSSAFSALSAVVLAEGRGDQDQSNGDKLTGFTNLLYSFLGAYGRELRAAGAQIDNGLRQMVIHQAEDTWLDLWGALYNTPRETGEDDAGYADRIPEEAFRLRVNALAIEKAILDLTGKDVRLEEPWGELFRLDESQMSGTHKFYNGSVYGYHILRPVSTESIDWTDVLAVIERNRAAGVVVLPPESRLGFFVDATTNGDVEMGQAELTGEYLQMWVAGRLDYMRLSDYDEIAPNYRVSSSMTLVSAFAEYDGPVDISMQDTEITGLTWRTAASPWDDFPWGEGILSRTLVAPPRVDVYAGAAVQIDVEVTVFDDAEVVPGGGGYDPDAQAIIDAMDTEPTTGRKALIDDTVIALKAAGIFAKADVLAFRAAADEQAGLLDWKRLVDGSWIPGDGVFVADSGFDTDWHNGGEGMRTGYNPLTDAVNYTQDSACIAALVSDYVAASGSGYIFGAKFLSTGSELLFLDSGSLVTGRMNSSGLAEWAEGTSASPEGFWILQRTASNAVEIYKNGALFASSSQVSNGITNDELQQGESNGLTICARHKFLYAGAPLDATERTALQTIVNDYLAGL